jgi:hypothetical protein
VSAVDHFRAFARRPVQLTAAIRLASDASWRETARVVDMGLGGACIEVAEALAPGTPVRLQMTSPHLWDPLELRALVAWGREGQADKPPRIGVRFEHASGNTLRHLVELLETQNYEYPAAAPPERAARGSGRA